MSLGHILDVSLAFPVYLCEAHTCVKHYLKILELLPVKECCYCECLCVEKRSAIPPKFFILHFLNQCFPFKISLVILFTICHTILMKLVQRIWY